MEPSSIKRPRRKKLLAGAAVLVSLLAGAGAINAGLKLPATDWEVRFTGNGTTGAFEGYLGSARNSSDGNQYIGCELHWYGPTANNLPTVNPSNMGYCWAADRNGNVRSCYITVKYGTAAALLANVVQDSYIHVSYFTVSGQPYCGAVDIYNYSYDPKK
jgi:hypothetical protein